MDITVVAVLRNGLTVWGTDDGFLCSIDRQVRLGSDDVLALYERGNQLLVSSGRFLYDATHEPDLLYEAEEDINCITEFNGRLVLALDSGCLILLLHGECIARVDHGSAVNACCVMKEKLYSGGMDCQLVTWGAQFQPITKLNLTETQPTIVNPPFINCLEQMGHVLLAALGDGRVYVHIDTDEDPICFFLQEHRSAVNCICKAKWDSSGTQFVTSGNDRQIIWWDLSLDEPYIVQTWTHQYKVNWITTCTYGVYVADVHSQEPCLYTI